MRRELEGIDRFLSVEHFQSLSNPGKMLSLSFFRDEEAASQWRNTAAHRATQARGRNGVFAVYRLRVAGMIRDDGMVDRVQTPTDGLAVHTSLAAMP